MRPTRPFLLPIRAVLFAALLSLGALSASAHLSYPAARDFGIFTTGAPRGLTIGGQTTTAFGWADGTDANFARQDDQRYFQFTLEATTTVWISAQAVDASVMLPAFTIYSGRGHGVTDASNADYDGAAVTVSYLASLGDPQPRQGAFDALHTFKIGNDSKPADGYVAELVTLTYVDHKADGVAANYGPTAGIKGDGVADGFVTGSYTLAAGSYTLAVGGANYFTTVATARGIVVGVSTAGPIPEPSTALLVGLGAVIGLLRRHRPSPMGV